MADDTQREVLSNLPRARKTKRSSKRGDSPAAGSRAAEGSASAPTRAKASSASPKTASKAKPKTAAKSAAKAKPKSAAKAKPKTAAKAKAPTPISSAKSSRAARANAQKQKPEQAPPAGWATPEDAGGSPPGGLEIVTTGVRAVGELGQLGAAVAGQAVKGILSRIPKP
jgi:hypothetical protein